MGRGVAPPAVATVIVDGDPVAQPRIRPTTGGARGLGAYMPRTAEGWRQLVTIRAREQYRGAPLDVPLEVRATFWLRRPRSHFTKAGALVRSAPAEHGQLPDVDNLWKALDCLNGVLWRDDSLVVRLDLGKFWADDGRPGLTLSVRPWQGFTSQ